MEVGCAICKTTQDLSRCSGCKNEFYCSKQHQNEHWAIHQLTCKREALFDPLVSESPCMTEEEFQTLRIQSRYLKLLSPSILPPIELTSHERIALALLIE